MLSLLLNGVIAAPLAGQVQQQASSISSGASEVDGGIDVGTATEPDDCICCERSLAAMTRYCKAEMPMGDLKMANFDCAKEMGTEITFNSDNSHQRWSAIKSCKCDCDKRLAELKSIDCPMACKRLPFACPICAPPPPPPNPPPPPAVVSMCKPVEKPCCEAVLEQLEKFCYSFEPKGEAIKIADPTHWDGGVWQPPASFDQLCESYSPKDCEPCGQLACPRVLQLISRQFHPNVCDAIKSCNGFCDNQCPSNSTAATLFGYLDSAAGKMIACTGAECKGDVSQKTMQEQEQKARLSQSRPRLNSAQWQHEEAELSAMAARQALAGATASR
jgi:hypothetical protein